MPPSYASKRAGNYTIVQKLGDGGFATVYLAQHSVLEKKAAVKFLLEEWVNEPDVVARFFDEARTMERLKDHPNIVGIIDIATKEICDREGLPPYFIMEFVDGESLEKKIHSDEGFTLEFILSVMESALSALGHCHKLGVIHRDIKPSNILLTKDAGVKLTDFGIAKAKLNTSKTGNGLTLGSTDYMSPEQALGKRDMDFRSDIYSIGVTLYELVTGKLPFVSDNPNSVALMHIQEEPKAPVEVNEAVPQKLNDLILKAMEKKPENRFQSCQEMIDALKALSEPDKPVEAEGETVDLSKVPHGELPEDGIKIPESPSEIARRTTQIQQSLASGSLRVVFTVVGLFCLFLILILGAFKAYTVMSLGTLTFAIEPAGTEILVDGNQVGTSPFTLKLPAASYKVALAYKGFREKVIKVVLSKGETRTVKQALRRIDPAPLSQLKKLFEGYSVAGSAPPKTRQQAVSDALQKVLRFMEDPALDEEVHMEFLAFCKKESLLAPADNLYKKLIEKSPSALHWTMQGKVKVAKEESDGALECFSKAWELDNNDILLLNSLGEYFSKKEPVRAKDYFNLSLFLNPNQQDILQRMKEL